MEPLNELIFTMMVDISVWLREYEGKMIMDSETNLSQLEYFIGSWEVLFKYLNSSVYLKCLLKHQILLLSIIFQQF